MSFRNELAENLLHARLDSGMTQRELGRRSGVSANAISQYENAQRSPDVYRLALIAVALGVSPAELVPQPQPIWVQEDHVDNMTIYDIIEEEQ